MPAKYEYPAPTANESVKAWKRNKKARFEGAISSNERASITKYIKAHPVFGDRVVNVEFNQMTDGGVVITEISLSAR